MFAKWAALNGVQALPASPAAVAAVAKFVHDISYLGAERVWDEIMQIRREHWVRNLADPCIGMGPVSEAMNRISKVVAPRSWRAEAKEEFMWLPYPVQLEIVRRDAEREREMRRAQNEVAEMKKHATVAA
jgi:hypothetical protein